MSLPRKSSAVRRLSWLLLFAVVAAAAWWGAKPLAVYYYSGRARQRIHRRADREALRELRRVALLEPRRAETCFLLARVHRRLGNLELVPVLLDRAKRLGGDPDRAEREVWLAEAQVGHLRDIEPHLMAMFADPRDDGPDICQAFAQGYFTNLRVPEAQEVLNAWKEGYPEDALAHFMEAYLLQSLEREEEAVDAYRRGLELAPHDTKMRCRLGRALTVLRRFKEARACFQQCLEEEPDEAEALAALANCEWQSGDIGKARVFAEQALEHRPSHFECLRMLGEMEVMDGAFQAASQHLRSALALRPYDTTTHNALGKSLSAMGRGQEAQVHFEYVAEAEESLAKMERQLKMVVNRPDDVALRYEIGATLLQYGDPDDGVRWLKTVLELEPNHQATRDLLAAFAESQNRPVP